MGARVLLNGSLINLFDPRRATELSANSEETSSPPLFGFRSSELLSRLANAATSVAAASSTLAPNDSALCFFWDRLATVTNVWWAVLDFKTSEMLGGTFVPLAAPPVEPVRLSPPLTGGPWVAVYDPHVPRGHRRVAFTHDARLVVPARFAIDWIRLDESGRATDAVPNDFGRWYGFGADVLAVADAKVVAVRDSYLDVLTSERRQKRSEDDGSGNYVGLALPSGQCAFYEHLQQGSVRVKAGDTVSAGQPIARLGRSGINSAGPHLHFHVGSAPLDARFTRPSVCVIAVPTARWLSHDGGRAGWDALVQRRRFVSISHSAQHDASGLTRL